MPSEPMPGVAWDPAEILRALPQERHAQFLSEYHAALDAAHDPAQFAQLRTLLGQWRLRAMAYARPGYREAIQDAIEGREEGFVRHVPAEWTELRARLGGGDG
ncbi:hypothetical protein SAMN05421678_102497 [Actinopolymorpha cephalotaxi]|uniref:Uncharacterized protein n=1 Tax=Actinopolymorpha cephalotaxi TaxID=504797 RepID=A0A1I2MEV7_9ACTN|nr:DUF6247 family protein [Actinopolymorpha cephalotaxi]NYH81634.1 hypothetical protein [Actinopolymorpha cephalotaxi]SFF87711.1 hypothetical protein SAMN05421678_102497 [Actinopolymorpha cephalotaxi]